MLANSRSSARLAQDASYETRLYGRLDLQQELGWVQCSAVLKSNLLFLYEGVTGVAQLNQLSNPAPPLEHPHMTIIVEGCVVDMVDSNACGADFSFAITFSSTGRRIVLAAQNEQEMERWVAQLSSSSMQHISLAKQALLEQVQSLCPIQSSE